LNEAGTGPAWERALLEPLPRIAHYCCVAHHEGATLATASRALGFEHRHRVPGNPGVCNGGAFFFLDRCDDPGALVAVEVLSDANLGNRGREVPQEQIIFGLVGSRAGRQGTEDFWSESYLFLGWWNRAEHDNSDTTPYGVALRFFGF